MSWIYNIIGVVFIGILFDILLPINKINKFMKCIFSVFVLYSIITPVLNMVSNNNISDVFESTSTEIDINFINQLNASKNDTYEKLIQNAIENEGILNVDVEILNNLENDTYEISIVEINLLNCVLIDNKTNINKYEVITKQVKKYVEISEDKIVFYEWFMWSGKKWCW